MHIKQKLYCIFFLPQPGVSTCVSHLLWKRSQSTLIKSTLTSCTFSRDTSKQPVAPLWKKRYTITDNPPCWKHPWVKYNLFFCFVLFCFGGCLIFIWFLQSGQNQTNTSCQLIRLQPLSSPSCLSVCYDNSAPHQNKYAEMKARQRLSALRQVGEVKVRKENNKLEQKQKTRGREWMRGLDAGGRLAESEESFSNCGLGDGDEKKHVGGVCAATALV